ncbi:type II toxin-antitoxin system VapC family toxin [Candidatus Regiella endosymbiont of Tuberolachnus salignus]|uniref:PIN domain-containing protein n=1 Tax=Candidatus Regiella endosymbiont of Tuberolachnus salignus TaxID=3077956 RepID=UPI0030CEB460
MIGLDTNVLVRYVTQDDPIQSPKATHIIESLSKGNQGFITVVSVVELVWVLTSCYHSKKEEIILILEILLRTKELTVERAEVVWQALHRFSCSKADFADCLIERCAHAAACEYTLTFDNKAAKTVGMRQIP